MKKSSKILLAAFSVAVIGILSLGAYIKYLLSLPEPEGVPILEYHLVQKETPIDDGYRYNVYPEDFVAQLKYLKDEGYTTIHIRDFLRAKKGLQELPEKPVILTFDDGYDTNYTELLPILKEHDVKATVFMITNNIGKEGFLTWEQLKDMQKQGIEIGSHTANHLPLTSLELEKAREEVKLSKLLMEWNGMDTIYTFSYPNGEYDEKYLDMLEQEEYLAAVTGDAGLNSYDTNPYLLQRINIPSPVFGIDEFKYRLLKGRLMAQIGWDQHKSGI